MNNIIHFNCKWIENAVRDCLQKKDSDITSEDIEKITYLKIGEGFDNTFIIEMSIACPPNPFKDMYGGDEWEMCCLGSKDILRYIDKYKRENNFQFSMYKFEHDNNWNDDEDENTDLSLKDFEESIYKTHFYQKIEDEDEWEKWYDDTNSTFCQDIKYFTNIEVLRLYGGKTKDLSFLNDLKCLRVVEITETCFENTDGIENFLRLQQLCCWMD